MASPMFRDKGACGRPLSMSLSYPVGSKYQSLGPLVCRCRALALPDLPERFPTSAIFNLPQGPNFQVIWTNGMVCANL